MSSSAGVRELIAVYVTEELRALAGTLASVVDLVQNNWLPADGDPQYERQIAGLREHLAGAGHEHVDPFLLRVGLTVPGEFRGIVPPLLVLEENRGGLSPRRLREAEGRVVRLHNALAIGRASFPELPADTQGALLELAAIAQQGKKFLDTDWLRWYSQASAEQCDELAQYAIGLLDQENETFHEIAQHVLQHLTGFRAEPLSEHVCEALIKREYFWPASIYRDTGDDVARQFIALLNQTNESLRLNHLLLALAWTRSTEAERAFAEWVDSLPSWADELNVPPSEYTPHAGWCLSETGERRDIVSRTCLRLRLADSPANHAGIPCRTSAKQKCPACSARLSYLFDFSNLDSQLLAGVFNAPRRILCCLQCACYGAVFASYQQNDNGEFLAAMEPSDTGGDFSHEPCLRVLDREPLPVFACAEPFYNLNDCSTLGGVPTWLQDGEYPRCLECGRVMPFVAQHDNGELSEEGIFYAFYCDDCRVSAVVYQQT
jgi:hypothetical protein